MLDSIMGLQESKKKAGQEKREGGQFRIFNSYYCRHTSAGSSWSLLYSGSLIPASYI
ncbi:hypothetical protein EXN66_Car015172 [Channa argus]|uniref:Uncharacterized protein n=1 Tax=Channa argus TaxID=215402 RepID=A0A6G1QAB1_CHAAH|nr:hypothetical protein EXN66_Car015172 [Channa argus]